jgi:alpha-amylase
VGYFITEDSGNLFKIFPLREELRYAIPFKDPEFTLSYLQSYVRENGNNVIVYADDLEKFGIWPKTHKHVYQDGWLLDFLKHLTKNRDWLKTITFAEAIENLKPVDKIYLPTASYREMGEWAMLSQSWEDFRSFGETIKNLGKFNEFKHFMLGGLWRNFKVKYPETNLMYARMLGISRKLQELDKKGDIYKKAQRELYRAQSNCPYWHGVFGGVYLPHLRNSVFAHLLKA